MITDDQIIKLASATLQHKDTYPIAGEHITESTDGELIRYTREVIDAATVGLRAELEASNAKGFELCTELDTVRAAYQRSRKVATPRNVLVERIARLNPEAGEIGEGMLASLVEDARYVLSLPSPE